VRSVTGASAFEEEIAAIVRSTEETGAIPHADIAAVAKKIVEKGRMPGIVVRIPGDATRTMTIAVAPVGKKKMVVNSARPEIRVLSPSKTKDTLTSDVALIAR
jgi:hypothetical protein